MNRAAQAASARAAARRNAHQQEDRWDLALLAFVALHAPLGLASQLSPVFATTHAATVFAAGMWIAASSRNPAVVVAVAAYITGAEVLWRMTDTALPWEFGKYATVAVFLVALGRRAFRGMPVLPAIYLALLLPSVALTVTALPFGEWRRALSFNLSGPLTLFVCAWMMSAAMVDRRGLVRIFLVLAAPTVAIAAIAAYGTLTATRIQFTGESNFATSGGFGPNQVSSLLGLGALALFLVFVYAAREQRLLRGVAIGLMMALGAQSALTFSRSGLYLAAAGIAASGLMLLPRRELRLRLVVLVLAAVLLGGLVVYPRLNSFTGGALETRFSDTTTTGRSEIAAADLAIWRKHPLLGVGPGMGAQARGEYVEVIAAHTELTRLLAEHGVLGLFALLALVSTGLSYLFRGAGPMERAAIAGMLAWVALYLASNGMRTAAPSFLFGLAGAAFALAPPTSARVRTKPSAPPAMQRTAPRR